MLVVAWDVIFLFMSWVLRKSERDKQSSRGTLGDESNGTTYKTDRHDNQTKTKTLSMRLRVYLDGYQWQGILFDVQDLKRGKCINEQQEVLVVDVHANAEFTAFGSHFVNLFVESAQVLSKHERALSLSFTSFPFGICRQWQNIALLYHSEVVLMCNRTMHKSQGVPEPTAPLDVYFWQERDNERGCTLYFTWVKQLRSDSNHTLRTLGSFLIIKALFQVAAVNLVVMCPSWYHIRTRCCLSCRQN